MKKKSRKMHVRGDRACEARGYLLAFPDKPENRRALLIDAMRRGYALPTCGHASHEVTP